MNSVDLVQAAQWLFLLYFIGLNFGYLLLNAVAVVSLTRYMNQHAWGSLPQAYASYEPPISVLVPAFNEEATIAASLRSLLQLNYPEYEIVVINDGSRDRTLEVLTREFSLVPFPEAYRQRLATRPVRGIFASPAHPNLRVVDKENGGKADALNVGINCARYPLFCGVDADSVLQRDSLQRVVQPFLEDPRTVAAGGTIRIANGCVVSEGFLTRVGIPRRMLPLFQVVEYLRAFLFGRLGWSPLNALLIISGAFGLFYKERVIAAGGYRTDTVGEDMDLVVRLHQMLRREGRPYRITFVPDPICWTEAPEDFRTLKNQRVRWQRGLAESLWRSRGMLFHPRSGTVGWLAFPFMLVFELLGPLIEVVGYLFMGVAYSTGMVSGAAFLAFLTVALGLGALLSVNALLLEEFSFHLYPRMRDILILFGAALLENFGYRQLITLWRLGGFLRWWLPGKGQWGAMVRKGGWRGDK